MKNINLILIIILIILIIVIVLRKRDNNIEGFIGLDNNDQVEVVDEVYAKIYDIVFNEEYIFDKDIEFIEKNITPGSSILEVGVGTGKYFNKLFKNYKMTGVDRSTNMLKYARIRTPTGNFMRGDIRNDQLYNLNTFDGILCTLDTLYHNTYNNQFNIISNINKWLKSDGKLFIHIFDYNKLVPAPRVYSSHYVDSEDKLHAFTEFDNFSHDGLYEKFEDHVIYKEKIEMRDSRKYYNSTKLYIPKNKNQTIEMIIRNNFKLVDIYQVDGYDLLDIELYCFIKVDNETVL